MYAYIPHYDLTIQTESNIKDDFAAHNITVKSRSFETTEDPTEVIKVLFVSRYIITNLAIDVAIVISLFTLGGTRGFETLGLLLHTRSV